MARKIEQLLRFIADMENFSKEMRQDTVSCDSTELSYEELNLVSAASAPENIQSTKKHQQKI